MNKNIKITIDLDNQTKDETLSSEEIEQTVLTVLQEKGVTGNIELGIKICGQEKMREINREFRQIDAPTDVLSFPIWESIPAKIEEPILLGDIIICPDILRQNAREYGVTEREEFIKMIAHGTLHLLGFHHK